jgi:hypothetical protein
MSISIIFLLCAVCLLLQTHFFGCTDFLGSVFVHYFFRNWWNLCSVLSAAEFADAKVLINCSTCYSWSIIARFVR